MKVLSTKIEPLSARHSTGTAVVGSVSGPGGTVVFTTVGSVVGPVVFVVVGALVPLGK